MPNRKWAVTAFLAGHLIVTAAHSSPVWPQLQFLPLGDGEAAPDLTTLDDGFVVGRPRLAGTGAVQLVERAGDSLILGETIFPAATGVGALFGQALATRDDLLAVAEPRTELANGPHARQVKVYERAGGSWQFEAQLANELGTGPDDVFGQTLAIAGSQIAVGAPGLLSQRGAILLFDNSTGTWREAGLLTGFDTTNFSYLGRALAASEDTIVAGAPGWRPIQGGDSPGAAYVFSRLPDGSWAQSARLAPSLPVNLGQYGASVSIDGDTIVVGAPFEQVSGQGIGVAYVYRRNGDDWVEQTRLFASDGSVGDAFGVHVALSASTLCIYAPFADNGFGSNAGTAYVYERVEQDWIEVGRLTPIFETSFGRCAIGDGAIALIGAEGTMRGLRVFPAGQSILADGFE